MDLLERVDYEDAFQVDALGEGTPAAWMRAIIEGAPRWFQLPWINLLGRGILRAQIGPMHAPGYVLGWKVLLDRSDVFVVGLDGADGFRARLITVTPPGRAVFATQIRLGSVFMRTFWPAIRPGHRFFAPFLLSRAGARTAGGSDHALPGTNNPASPAMTPVGHGWRSFLLDSSPNCSVNLIGWKLVDGSSGKNHPEQQPAN
ncbi:MAG TPA: hypothetical protein VFE65_25245 [Pseudonocardia sp.]|nr:hypothetical protein [Pseudonocardia sp.]